jgi:hypothetical protein
MESSQNQIAENSQMNLGQPQPPVSQECSTMGLAEANTATPTVVNQIVRVEIPKPIVTTKGWSLDDLLSKSKNFHPVRRLDYSTNTRQVRAHVIDDGEPLILEGFQNHEQWVPELLCANWVRLKHGNDGTCLTVTYLIYKLMFLVQSCMLGTCGTSMIKLQLSEIIWIPVTLRARTLLHLVSSNSDSGLRSLSSIGEDRWYGKDMNCPDGWTHWLKSGRCIPYDYLPEGTDDLFTNFPAKVNTSFSC